MSITRNGVEIPDEFAGSEETILAYMASNPRPAGSGGGSEGQGGEGGGSGGQGGEGGQGGQGGEGGGSAAAGGDDKIDLVRFKELETRHNDLLAKFNDLNSKAENFVDVDPDAWRLSIVKSKDPEKFGLYAGLKLSSNMKPLDILVEDFVLRNPGFKDRKAQVIDLLVNKYKLDEEIPSPLSADDGHDEDAVSRRNSEIEKAKKAKSINEIQMEVDANEAKARLLGEFDKIELPTRKKETPEELQAKKDALKTSWAPVVQAVFKDAATIPLFMPAAKEGEKPEMFLEMPVTDELKKVYSEQMLAMLSESGAELTKDNLAAAVARFRYSFINDNLPEIIKSVADKARALTDDEYAKMYHNPSGLAEDKSKNPAQVSKQQESINKILEMEGIKV